jgi:hypothetical protein
MTNLKIRFNTEHNGSELKWRVIIDDDEEHLAKNIIINCPCKTTEDWVLAKDLQVIKHHITCESDNWSWDEDKVLTIN